jgi:xanthine dehydrogenase molybdopterin-binding subunit B
LEPVKAQASGAGWDAWVKTAYMQRINLSAQGFFSLTLERPMNWETGKGEPFNYFAYGVSCSEVEIDCLTGDFTVLRTDIVNDVGDSINPAIDIGQVRGVSFFLLTLFGLCVTSE